MSLQTPPCYTVVVLLLVVLLLNALLHRYFYVRLVRDPSWSKRFKTVAGTSLICLALLIPVGLFAMRALPRVYATPVAMAVFI
ncbi:MAG: hypothetical protein AAFV29_13820, partial [Myxococcota bacterium]